MASSTDKPLPVFVVTGPSGAGKGTLIKRLLERQPELEVAISATTRPQRPGEQSGREYWFLSEEEFVARIEEGAFLEHVTFVGGRYGTLASELDRIAAEGRVCILELETDGALKVQEEVEHSITLFIAADVPELERRLRARDTESSGEIGDRIALARHQLEQAYRFRYMVRNDDVARATEALSRPDRARARSCSYHGPSMIRPRIDELLNVEAGGVDSRYALVIVAAKRARQINNYHHQLGEGMGFEEAPPPLVESRSKNYLTMSLEEIAQGKIKYDYGKR